MPMMNFEEFTEFVAKHIKNYLPSEYADSVVSITKVNKLGSSYTGLTVGLSGKKAVPTVNLDQFYREYAANDRSGELMRGIAQIIMTHTLDKDYDWIPDYEKARDKLFVRVSNAERNEEMLKSVPHVMKEDIVMTCHVLVSMDRGVASTVVNDRLLKAYGISEDQLFKDAIENGQKLFPVKVESLETMIFNMAAEEGYNHPINPQNNMLVVTNDQSINGAAALFYPDEMDKIADLLQDDFYVIPSSIHECLVIPESTHVTYQRLESMLKDVNSAMVAHDEQLSDHVYHYDSAERLFELAEDYAVRMQLNTNELSNAFVM